MKTDDPMQYFFTYGLNDVAKQGTASQLAAAMEKAGVKAPVKMESQPLEKNKIMIRLENVAD